MLVRPVESKCAIVAQLAIWVQTRNAYIVPGERPGLEALDGPIGIRGWGTGEIRQLVYYWHWERRYGGLV
jgi:hypothetical protein